MGGGRAPASSRLLPCDFCCRARPLPPPRSHHRYYEPLAEVVASAAAVAAGPPLHKVLFMTSVEAVEARLKPHWRAALEGTSAELMQAVPDMLEVVPSGEVLAAQGWVVSTRGVGRGAGRPRPRALPLPLQAGTSGSRLSACSRTWACPPRR